MIGIVPFSIARVCGRAPSNITACGPAPEPGQPCGDVDQALAWVTRLRGMCGNGRKALMKEAT
jgi:hypothetical protein